MTRPISHDIPDIQSLDDHRKKSINQVGIRSVRHRLIFIDAENNLICPTISSTSMYVTLAEEKKATHMSRFVEFLNEEMIEVSLDSFAAQLIRMTKRLTADTGFIKLNFPLLIDKEAPLSKVPSSIDYEVTLYGRHQNNQIDLQIQLKVPMTTLCPCSKEISEYGAHNQRSYITLTALLNKTICLKDLIFALEAQGSAQVYSLLKRIDEKFVTEYAYDHPKFVEDLIRDLAKVLDNYDGIQEYRIEGENIESIHNHNAYAMIETTNKFIDIR